MIRENLNKYLKLVQFKCPKCGEKWGEWIDTRIYEIPEEQLTETLCIHCEVPDDDEEYYD